MARGGGPAEGLERSPVVDPRFRGPRECGFAGCSGRRAGAIGSRLVPPAGWRSAQIGANDGSPSTSVVRAALAPPCDPIASAPSDRRSNAVLGG